LRRNGRGKIAGLGVAITIIAVAAVLVRTCRTPRTPRGPARGFDRTVISWPGGVKAAVSLTFDHAFPSQLDRAIPILEAHGLRASFYVNIGRVRKRLDGWRNAVASGHEVGNHTLRHPCSGDYAFERSRRQENDLEIYTLEAVENDIEAANAEIRRLLGVSPRTFAYPCGEMFVGRGEGTQSYVPVVARLFLAGRGFGLDFTNSPGYCDLAKVNALASDGYTFEMYMRQVNKAGARGDWVIFCGHAIGDTRGPDTTLAGELDRLCAWLDGNRKLVWTGTVAEVADYIEKARAGRQGEAR